MIRPIIALCALLISPVWGQEPQSDLDDPEKLLARCLHEEGLYFGRRLMWADGMFVYYPLVDDLQAMKDQCDPRLGKIFAFDVEVMEKVAKGSAFIVENCPIGRLRYPKAWIDIDWDLDRSKKDFHDLEAAKRQLLDWEIDCGEVE